MGQVVFLVWLALVMTWQTINFNGENFRLGQCALQCVGRRAARTSSKRACCILRSKMDAAQAPSQRPQWGTSWKQLGVPSKLCAECL